MDFYKDNHDQKMPQPIKIDPRNLNLHSFRWCGTEYTPRELAEIFEDYIPFMIMTTQGYLGRDEWVNAVASDEVYWLREIAREPRIVVNSEQNGYFSIPIKYQHKVLPLKNGLIDGGEMTIAELVASNQYIDFRFAGGKTQTKMPVCHGADSASSVHLGDIQIVDRYDERFLVVHCLSSGRLYPQAYVIPVYMPVAVTIAVGMARSDHRDFLNTMMNMNNYIDSVPKQFAYPKQLNETCDILMYDEKPIEGEYDFLEPVKYVKLGKPDKSDELGYTTLINTQEKSKVQGPTLPRRTQNPNQYQQPIKPQNTKSIEFARPQKQDLHQLTGKGTSIQAMSKLGYHIQKINPFEILGLLKHTLQTGILPNHIDMEEFLWTDSDDGQPESDKKSKSNASQKPVIEPRSRSGSENKGEKYVPPTGEYKKWNSPLPPPPPVSPPAETSRPPIQGFLQELQSVTKDTLKKRNSKPHGTHLAKPNITSNESATKKHHETSSANPPIQHSDKLVPTKSLPSTYKPPDGQKPTQNLNQGDIRGVEDVPRDIRNLNCKDISKCLSWLKLDKYKKKMFEEQVDGALLYDMDVEILQEDFGFKKFEAFKLIKFAREGWRPGTDSSAEADA